MRPTARHELHELSRISAANFSQHRVVENSQPFNVSTLQRFNLAKPFVGISEISVLSFKFVNGTERISDIEGKAATGSGERAGMRASFKFVSRVCERNHAANFLQNLTERADGQLIR
jgi:hypothetical protein